MNVIKIIENKWTPRLLVLVVVAGLGGYLLSGLLFNSGSQKQIPTPETSNSTVSNPSLVKTLGATNEATQPSRNESTQPAQAEYSPPSTSTYIPPQTPPTVVECNTALLDAWKSSYASTQSYYDSLVVAENTRSASRLQSALNELNRRGMGFSGLADEARNNERILKEQNLNNIENNRNAALLSLQNSYPANCN